ncbi:hypothetical protein Bca52824_083063 [Brassica carinata]|uniref:Mitochondrial import inner membrane translocase subunit n=1 Tax=Brassica carinata TaxID=52824 RepID=A0A8X7PLK8_BRACI|nr:hypothetical protein Bca52824_083063 [Brassica carinata]
MDSYSSSSSPPMGASPSPEALMEQVQAQLAEAYAKDLSSGESSCISRCVDRYMEATGIISRSLFTQQR